MDVRVVHDSLNKCWDLTTFVRAISSVRSLALSLSICVFLITPLASKAADNGKYPASIYVNPAFAEQHQQLEHEIHKILAESPLPALVISLVNESGVVWRGTYGYADIESGNKTTPESIFRIGSISKVFASIAVMQLSERGLLTLNDKGRDIIPEVHFENPWQDSAPVRVVHLLEHTTGWEELHFTEWAYNNDKAISTLEALRFKDDGRTSRWMPGTRHLYSNKNTVVAAYIVEKLSGMPYEDYVKAHLLEPMALHSGGFFYEGFKPLGVTSYSNNQPQPFSHIIDRASGAAFTSQHDLEKLLQMFINRGKSGDIELLKQDSIERIETTETTLAAQRGAEVGYGLANYNFFHDGVEFRGHAGTLDGIADMFYVPGENIGYVMMTNTRDSHLADTYTEIERFLRSYMVKSYNLRTVNSSPPLQTLSATLKQTEGLYVKINHGTELADVFARLVQFYAMDTRDNALRFSPILSYYDSASYVPWTEHTAAEAGNSKSALAVVEDPLAGLAVDINGEMYVKVSLAEVILRLLIVACFALTLVASLFLPLALKSLSKRNLTTTGSSSNHLFYCALSCFLCSCIVLLITISVLFTGYIGLGNKSVGSLAIYLGSYIYVLVAFVSLYYLIKVMPSREKSHWMFALMTATHVVVACYLVFNGVVGLKTWV